MDCADIFIPAEVVFAFMVISVVIWVWVDSVPEVTRIGCFWGNVTLVVIMWGYNIEGFVSIADSTGVTGIPKMKMQISLSFVDYW